MRVFLLVLFLLFSSSAYAMVSLEITKANQQEEEEISFEMMRARLEREIGRDIYSSRLLHYGTYKDFEKTPALGRDVNEKFKEAVSKLKLHRKKLLGIEMDPAESFLTKLFKKKQKYALLLFGFSAEQKIKDFLAWGWLSFIRFRIVF